MAPVTCGHVRLVSGGAPHVCARPDGHDGRHATLNGLGEAIAQWDDQHVVSPIEVMQGRLNGHQRRPYQTLAMWKAGQ